MINHTNCAKRKEIHDNVKLPFNLVYKFKRGNSEKVEIKSVVSLLELKGITNVVGVMLRSGAKVSDEITVNMHTRFAGHYQVTVTQAQYKQMIKIIDSTEAKLDKLPSVCDEDSSVIEL